MKGSKNSNYSGISDGMIIRYAKDFCGVYGAYPSYKLLRIFCNSKNINLPIILTRNFRFVENGGGLVGYNNIVSALGEVITYHGTRDKYEIIKNNILEKGNYVKNQKNKNYIYGNKMQELWKQTTSENL